MRRREVISMLGVVAATWPLGAAAQPRNRIARIGYLAPNRATASRNHEAFVQGLRDLGHVEGQTFVFETRDAQGQFERLPALAAELVALNVDVIFAPPTVAARAAQQATRTLPIVFATSGDPISSGLVASLARPGGNLTGLSFLGPELVGKRLQLLKQAVPGVGKVAVLWEPGALGERTERAMLAEADVAARLHAVRLHVVEARSPSDIDKAMADTAASGAGALTVLPSAMFNSERRRLVDLAARSRLPTIYPWREFVDAGGLLSYGANFADLYRRSASYVDRIIKGAKPSDLAVQQPTQFEMVLNMKTAKTLGLTISPLVLAQADEVIE